MIEVIVGIYLLAAILLSGGFVALNKKSLSTMPSWKMLLLFALSPVLALREIIYILRGK